ncbi:hypothetical protein E5161_07390 [Cohnella pontilimi]|uniref:Thioredoxin-like fold domain-containing protein n=1 Tax=Cohnella pontilimi TaxID=2564100 RepID=A0A4U0FD45_9BACL|nr:hypothetical protein [Cohnella pontilimi]TJY42667.1 hypothetical protein E5161_07390 [Cohnella pontilimi]
MAIAQNAIGQNWFDLLNIPLKGANDKFILMVGSTSCVACYEGMDTLLSIKQNIQNTRLLSLVVDENNGFNKMRALYGKEIDIFETTKSKMMELGITGVPMFLTLNSQGIVTNMDINFRRLIAN